MEMQDVQRRGFLKVLGGAAIAAGTPVLGGCSAEFPAEAVAAWRGPEPGADLRRWALGYAILAPNSHNRQPWLADLREPDAIVLRIDRDRLLPETDPRFRQIVVSQGTFIEALALALRERGLRPDVELFPEGAFEPHRLDDRPVARIRWTPEKASARDRLFDQLLHRHTAKVAYDPGRKVAAETLALLGSVIEEPGVRFGGTTEPSRVEALREICWESAQVELLTPRTVMESIRLTRVGPGEIATHRDGIAVNGALPRIAAAVGAFDRSSPPAPGSTAYRQMMDRFESHSRSAMGFVWLSTPGDGGRPAEVRAGRAFMRLQLKATEVGLQVHPMSQAVQEFPEMRRHYDRLHGLLLRRPAAEETVQMFCRIGYAPAQQHTPRRGVEAIVRA
jgi:nitroreductase